MKNDLIEHYQLCITILIKHMKKHHEYTDEQISSIFDGHNIYPTPNHLGVDESI